MINKYRLVLVSVLVVAFTWVSIGHSSAATDTQNLIKVSPSIVNLDLNKDTVTSGFTIEVTNRSNQPLTLSLSSVDFKSLNDTGGVAFVGQSFDQLSKRHTLSSWLITATEPLVIEAGQTINTTVTVDNRSDLGPGGHYAAILYTLKSASTGTTSARVSVNQVASTLVFVRKLDGADFRIKLVDIGADRSLFSLPKNINLNIKNTGNVQAVARGLITIKDPRSKEVSRGLINTDSSLVLPNTNRIYRNAMIKTGSAWLPGIYKVQIAYRVDGESKLQYKDTSFLYVNFISVFGLGVVLILLWQNRKLLARLQRRVTSKPKTIK